MYALQSSLRLLPTLLTALVLGGAAAFTLAGGAERAPRASRSSERAASASMHLSVPDVSPGAPYALYLVDSRLQAEAVVKRYGDAEALAYLRAFGMPEVRDYVLQLPSLSMSVLVIPWGTDDPKAGMMTSLVTGEMSASGARLELIDLRR